MTPPATTPFPSDRTAIVTGAATARGIGRATVEKMLAEGASVAFLDRDRATGAATQAELAGRLDVSRQAVNAIETGKHDPSLPLAFRIARLFDMPIEEIFDDEL